MKGIKRANEACTGQLGLCGIFRPFSGFGFFLLPGRVSVLPTCQYRQPLLFQQPATLYDACSLLPLSPYLISFFAWSSSNSDVNMQLVHIFEFFELFFNMLVVFALHMELIPEAKSFRPNNILDSEGC